MEVVPVVAELQRFKISSVKHFPNEFPKKESPLSGYTCQVGPPRMLLRWELLNFLVVKLVEAEKLRDKIFLDSKNEYDSVINIDHDVSKIWSVLRRYSL